MDVTWGEQEFGGASVWDRRCARSLARIAEALGENHGLSFSAACGNALRQAAHRIFGRDSMTVVGLLQGHISETATRCEEWCGEEPVLVAQDTTELNYGGHHATEGLGYLSGDCRTLGLVAHSALAVTPAGLPLGVLWAQIWARDFADYGKKHRRIQRPTREKESQKWLDGLAGIEAALPPERMAIVIADREADFFDYFAAPRRPSTHLLVRAHQPRRIEVSYGDERVVTDAWSALAQATEIGRITVSVPAQPGRAAREAQLALRCVPVRMLVPRDMRRRREDSGVEEQPLNVWVVEAREVDPPADGSPLHWVLLSTLSVEDGADCARIVGYYVRRWVIERLHYTLKSGLRVERLQFDDAHSLESALAVCFVVAWHLLWLTHLARIDPEGPAAEVLASEQLQVLEVASRSPVRTRRDVVRAIARLGGFPGNPSAGEPGVKTLWLGFMRLTAMLEGWRLHEQARSYATR